MGTLGNIIGIIGIICFGVFLVSVISNTHVAENVIYLIIGNVCLVISKIKIGGIK